MLIWILISEWIYGNNRKKVTFGRCEKFKEVIDLVIKKIELNFMTSWQLAESLLIISSTMDKNYSAIMSKYMEHEDSYVREVVKEYFTL